MQLEQLKDISSMLHSAALVLECSSIQKNIVENQFAQNPKQYFP